MSDIEIVEAKAANEARPFMVLFAAMTGIMLVSLDVSVVNVAVESLQSSFHVPLEELQWVLNAYTLSYATFLLSAGALSDRMRPRSILMVGIALLIAGNLVLAETGSFAGLVLGTALWGAHMALTQGIFSRMIADSAPEQLRATSFGAFWFVSGIGGLLASLGAGWLWDREGASATFLTSAIVAAVALAMLSLLEEKTA